MTLMWRDKVYCCQETIHTHLLSQLCQETVHTFAYMMSSLTCYNRPCMLLGSFDISFTS